jgi:hypothetical protein
LVLWLVGLIDAKGIANLYGHEAFQQKLKNDIETQRMHFLPVFELANPRTNP